MKGQHMQRKKWVIAAFLIVLLLAIAAGAVFWMLPRSKHKTAEAAAAQYAPAGASLLSANTYYKKYVFRYVLPLPEELLQIEVDADTMRVKRVYALYDDGSTAGNAPLLMEEDVHEAARTLYPSANVKSLAFFEQNGVYIYEVTFEASDRYGKLTYDATTAALLESDVHMGVPVVLPVLSGQAERKQYLSPQEAETIALNKTPGGISTDIVFDLCGGIYVYDVELVRDGNLYTVVLDAATGDTLFYKEEADWRGRRGIKTGMPLPTPAAGSLAGSPPDGEINMHAPGGMLTLEDAKALIVRHLRADNAVFLKMTLKEGKPPLYEGRVRKGGEVFSFVVDAESGVILEWEAKQTEDQPSEAAEYLSEEQITAIILARAGSEGARITEIKLKKERGRAIYEGEMRDDTFEYEFEIDAYTGTILEWETEAH